MSSDVPQVLDRAHKHACSGGGIIAQMIVRHRFSPSRTQDAINLLEHAVKELRELIAHS